MDLCGSLWFLVIFWWLFVILGDLGCYWWFLVVLDGSWRLLVVLGGFWLFFIVLGGS